MQILDEWLCKVSQKVLKVLRYIEYYMFTFFARTLLILTNLIPLQHSHENFPSIEFTLEKCCTLPILIITNRVMIIKSKEHKKRNEHTKIQYCLNYSCITTKKLVSTLRGAEYLKRLGMTPPPKTCEFCENWFLNDTDQTSSCSEINTGKVHLSTHLSICVRCSLHMHVTTQTLTVISKQFLGIHR